jgi:hypothetical protein
MILSTALLLLPLLGVAPPPEGADHQQTVAELQAAIDDFASGDRRATIAKLERLAELALLFPDQAPRDHTVSEPVLRGWIVLAGLHLAEGDDAAASAVMDTAIRMARDQELPVRAYGPKVYQLYEQRLAALGATGTATIAIECEVECKAVVGGRLLSGSSEELLLGGYDVWIKATHPDKGDASWEHHKVELTAAGETQTVTYADPAPPVAVPEIEPEPAPVPKPKRMLPRAAEIAGVAVGVGLVVAGAVLLSFNGKCERTGQRPDDGVTPEECGNIYQTSASGYSLLGVGGGVLVVSGVLLAVDEVRVGRERGRQVMLGVSLKF